MNLTIPGLYAKLRKMAGRPIDTKGLTALTVSFQENTFVFVRENTSLEFTYNPQAIIEAYASR